MTAIAIPTRSRPEPETEKKCSCGYVTEPIWCNCFLFNKMKVREYW